MKNEITVGLDPSQLGRLKKSFMCYRSNFSFNRANSRLPKNVGVLVCRVALPLVSRSIEKFRHARQPQSFRGVDRVPLIPKIFLNNQIQLVVHSKLLLIALHVYSLNE